MDAQEQLPLWVVAAAISLSAVFLRRLLRKLDLLYDSVVGTPLTPGIRDDVDALKRAVFGAGADDYKGPERRGRARAD